MNSVAGSEGRAGASWSESGRSDAVCRAPAAISAGIIAAGDFRIDMEARSVTVRGRQLQLSAAEFDVLVFLTSHKKRLVTSSTLLTTKSQESGISQTEFLRALLSLRKKLQEEVPDAQYIQMETWVLYDFHPGLEPL